MLKRLGTYNVYAKRMLKRLGTYNLYTKRMLKRFYWLFCLILACRSDRNI